MSEFEVLSVLISIVIGLGLTNLLSGLGNAFHYRAHNKMDAVHIAWTVSVFFLLVLNWWVALLWRGFENWTFTVFFINIAWTISMYMMTIALYPSDLSRDTNYREVFEANRTWLLVTFIVMVILDFVVSLIRDGYVINPLYSGYIVSLIVISVVGIVYKNRRYDLISAWYVAISLVAWSFGIRQIL